MIEARKKTKKYILIVGAVVLVAGAAVLIFILKTAGAEEIKVRQEINILDSILSAGAAAATSSEIVQLDTAQYSGTKTYYFEVVVNTSVSLTSTIRLRKKGTGTDDATISVPTNTTSYTRLRSDFFSPSATPIEYVVVNDGSGSGTVNVRAARIIILQSGTFTTTETQIEIGNYETGKTDTSTTTLSYPKYWYYDSSKWDGTVNFYAEVTWKKTDTGSSWATSTYTVSGDWNCPSGATQATIELWGGGGGGGGGGTQTNGNGGGGGAGGQYAKKTLTSPAAGSYPYTVGGGGSGSLEGVAGLQGGTTTFNTNVVVAGGGAGGGSGTGYGTGGIGSTYGCVGDAPYCYAGGNGGTGGAGYSGGGGGGAGSTGTGNSASGQTAGTAKTEYGGAGATGVTGNNAMGGSPSAGYGGGGAAGTGKTGDGGNGYAGLVRIAYESLDTSPTVTFVLQEDNGSFGEWTDKAVIVNATTTSGTITRTRSASFSPTSSGKNYRIAAYISNGTGHSYDIYNAKIIVDQSASPTKFEPQYLLANTYQSSSGLMDFDTSWTSAEWGRVYNSYFHEINCSSDTNDSAKLQVPPSTDVTNSTATGVAYRARSSEMIMPATNTIDVNVSDVPIYASRIIVQVVIGAPPNINSVSDIPDPVNDGEDITFSVNWSDDEDTAVKMVVCKTNSVATSTQTCTGGAGSTWCANNDDWDSANPISCSYTAQAGDSASNDYWVFVCDDHPSCSTSTYGTFAVNHKPTISLATDVPDPVNSGENINFSVDWSDSDSEGTKMFICKTNEISTTTQSCVNEQWCADSGSFSATNPHTCSYTVQAGDPASNNYWAFVCDDQVSCSASSAGSFAVNHKPTINTADDAPDPVNSNEDITFSVNWSDTDSEGVNTYICKTNEISTTTPGCVGETWCSTSGYSLTNPQTCSYAAQAGDPASNNYWAFVCDNQVSCSGSSSGTFTINHKPTISSVSDNPDPVTTGNDITFDVNWADTDSEGVNTYICKTNEISTTTPGCVGETWCSTSGYGLTNPQSCSYTVQTGDIGANDYYAFVCDNQVSCSSASSGSFTAQSGIASHRLKGAIKFLGNVLFK